jgi:hypothetical protein
LIDARRPAAPLSWFWLHIPSSASWGHQPSPPGQPFAEIAADLDLYDRTHDRLSNYLVRLAVTDDGPLFEVTERTADAV